MMAITPLYDKNSSTKSPMTLAFVLRPNKKYL